MITNRFEPPSGWRYAVDTMATPTTTIRVSRETHDLLTRQARDRDISLSALISQLARRESREEMFRAEREAIIADRENPERVAEELEWEVTTGDGIE